MPPDFIGIGAQKSATTWLYHILNNHPDIWMPPVKELHFFDDRKNEDAHIRRIILKKPGYDKSYRRANANHLKNIIWSYKFLFKKRNIDYYFSLFNPSSGQISGEISPGYAPLNIESIQWINKNLPDIKIIYILRNPIRRDWSSVCMKYQKMYNASIEDITTDEIIQRVRKSKFMKHSNYLSNLQNWEQVYQKKNMFIAFYDEIQSQPKLFLGKLFNFLELPPIDLASFNDQLFNKTSSFSKIISAKVLYSIAEIEYENIFQINQRFNNKYTAAWLKEAEQILEL